MKKLFLILLFTAITLSAQRPPDEYISFTKGSDVNAALLQAQAAITGTGVANQLTYWTGTKTIGSLATATYPSLTEMTYLKGVTSKIQTQLNSKQSTLVSGTSIKTVNGQSLLGSGNITINASSDTTGLWLKIYNEVKRQLVGDMIKGTASTLDSMIIDFRKNNYLRLNK